MSTDFSSLPPSADRMMLVETFVRIVDAERHTLVYLTYSDRLIEGSPQNAITAVPVDRATPLPVK